MSMIERVGEKLETRLCEVWSSSSPLAKVVLHELSREFTRLAIEAIPQGEPDAWRYRYDEGKWTVQKNKPAWFKEGMADVELEPLFSVAAALKGAAE